MLTEKRTKTYLEQAGLSGFQELVRVDFPSVSPAINTHIHPDAIELCYIAKGSQVYAVGGQSYRVSAGMAFITYPNELHDSGQKAQEKDVQLYYMVIDTINHLDRFLGLTDSEGAPLARLLNGLNRCFYVGLSLKERLDEMIRLFEEKPPLHPLLLRSHACLMIHDLALASQRACPTLTGDIYEALMYIEDTLVGTPPSVSDMAARVHLSASYFQLKFKTQVGLPPTAYQLKRRIELAKIWLAEGKSVTQTAFELGFSSSQHFATTFRRYTDRTPREWKKRHLLPPAQDDG